MSTPASAVLVPLAAEGQPACGDRNLADKARCARPPDHPGGHLSRDGKYWQAAS